MINVSSLLSGVAADAMGLRHKRSTRALDFLGGSRRSFLNTSSLIGLAGLAVGAYQIFKDKSSTPSAPQVVPGTTVLASGGRSLDDFGSAPRSRPPPLPAGAAQDAAIGDVVGDMPLRAVRIMIAAARCDGRLGEEEMGELMSNARDAGLEAQMRAEWQSPRPLAEICAGVSDPAQKRDLFVLAYTVLRADEEITGAERVFLAQLASRLGFTAEQAEALGRETAKKIDQAG